MEGELQDKDLRTGQLSGSDLTKLQNISSAITSLSLQKECLWRQRSRIGWLASGDANTAFFHRSASARRSDNTLSAIQLEDGSWTTDPYAISDSLNQFYASLWASDSPSWLPRAQLPGPLLTEADNALLTRPVSEGEVLAAMLSLPRGKAPGVDGFNASFYRAYWDIIKKDVVEAVQLFFTSSTMRKKPWMEKIKPVSCPDVNIIK